MLEAVMRHLRNWFLVPGGVHHGTYTIEGGTITLPFLQNGQYFRIIGSVFNDGVYRYNAELNLKNEEFSGSIWALAVPNSFLEIVQEIESWNEKNGEKVNGPYQSESFQGYSYTLKSGENGAVTWQSVFAGRLNAWRKI